MGWLVQFYPRFSLPSSSPTPKAREENLIEESKAKRKVGTGEIQRSQSSSASIFLLVVVFNPLPGRAPPPAFHATAPGLLFRDPTLLPRPARSSSSSSLPIFPPAPPTWISRSRGGKNSPKAPGLTRRRRAAAEIWARRIRRPFPAAFRRGYVGEFPCRRGSVWCQTKPARIAQFGRERPKGSLPPLPSHMVVRL